MSESARRIGLPVREFFYTPEQIAALLEVKESYVRTTLLHYDSRSVGPCPTDKIKAIKVSPDGEPPVWRIPERAFVRWMRFKKLRYYSRGYVA